MSCSKFVNLFQTFLVETKDEGAGDQTADYSQDSNDYNDSPPFYEWRD